jgi:glutamate racemase
LLPEHVTIIDSGEAVARQTKAILEKFGNLNKTLDFGTHQFFINTDVKVLEPFVLGVDAQKEVRFLDF